jgi:hypothetical protein
MSKQNPTVKCSIDGGRVKPCEGLSEAAEIDGNGTRYQGIKQVSLISMDSGKLSRHCYILKSGGYSKRGIFLNFCPFCGNEVLPASQSLKTEAA